LEDASILASVPFEGSPLSCNPYSTAPRRAGPSAGARTARRDSTTAGIALFTAASLAGGLAQSAGWLLTARAIQGVGAAIAAPSTLALLMVSFREGRERTHALGWYSAVAGGGGSVGLVLGGILTSWVSWRWGLFVNVPIGIALIWLAPRFLPETERHTGRFDLTGAVTSTLGMSTLVYGFVRASENGWGERGTVASFVAAVVLLSAFVLGELRAEQPITPLHLFADRVRSGAYVARMLLVSAMFSTFFFMTQFLQGVLGFSALGAGLAFLPMTVVMFAMGRLLPRLTPRFGERRLLLGGLLLGADRFCDLHGAGAAGGSRRDATPGRRDGCGRRRGGRGLTRAGFWRARSSSLARPGAQLSMISCPASSLHSMLGGSSLGNARNRNCGRRWTPRMSSASAGRRARSPAPKKTPEPPAARPYCVTPIVYAHWSNRSNSPTGSRRSSTSSVSESRSCWRCSTRVWSDD
jgi:MFS family permease